MSMACGTGRQAGQVEVKFMSNKDGLGSRVCGASLSVSLGCPCLQWTDLMFMHSTRHNVKCSATKGLWVTYSMSHRCTLGWYYGTVREFVLWVGNVSVLPSGLTTGNLSILLSVSLSILTCTHQPHTLCPFGKLVCCCFWMEPTDPGAHGRGCPYTLERMTLQQGPLTCTLGVAFSYWGLVVGMDKAPHQPCGVSCTVVLEKTLFKMHKCCGIRCSINEEHS